MSGDDVTKLLCDENAVRRVLGDEMCKHGTPGWLKEQAARIVAGLMRDLRTRLAERAHDVVLADTDDRALATLLRDDLLANDLVVTPVEVTDADREAADRYSRDVRWLPLSHRQRLAEFLAEHRARHGATR